MGRLGNKQVAAAMSHSSASAMPGAGSIDGDLFAGGLHVSEELLLGGDGSGASSKKQEAAEEQPLLVSGLTGVGRG